MGVFLAQTLRDFVFIHSHTLVLRVCFNGDKVRGYSMGVNPAVLYAQSSEMSTERGRNVATIRMVKNMDHKDHGGDSDGKIQAKEFAARFNMQSASVENLFKSLFGNEYSQNGGLSYLNTAKLVQLMDGASNNKEQPTSVDGFIDGNYIAALDSQWAKASFEESHDAPIDVEKLKAEEGAVSGLAKEFYDYLISTEQRDGHYANIDSEPDYYVGRQEMNTAISEYAHYLSDTGQADKAKKLRRATSTLFNKVLGTDNAYENTSMFSTYIQFNPDEMPKGFVTAFQEVALSQEAKSTQARLNQVFG